MTANIRALLSELSTEPPISHKRLRIIPLRLKNTSDLEYLPLDESSTALVTVEESSASGSVPELRVRNRAKTRVFIPDGSTLIGAKQNRVVNLSVMVAPDSVTAIPVSCVERGRWQFLSPHFEHGACADSPLRAMMCAGTTDSLKRTGKVHVDQGMVWNHVEAMLGRAGARSPTRAYHALYENWHQELADYEARLRMPDQAFGVAVAIDGKLEAVDLFDKPSTLHKLWQRLARSYIVAALCPQAPRSTKTDVNEVMGSILSSAGESYVPVGVGTSIRLTNADTVGAALVCNGRLVHLSAFAKGIPKPDGIQAPFPGPRKKEPGSDSKQSKPPRRWWSFWV
jgi:hypothetical protein